MSTAGRVAVIAVHGIADQQPGQTVRELSRLLCHGSAGEPPYIQGELHTVLVPVEALAPGAVQEPPTDGKARRDGPDAARRMPGTPSGFYQAQQPVAAAAQDATPGAQAGDLGLELNDYLLGRLKLPEAEALYESTRVSLRRRADGRQVDIYECYWADLSRLGSGGVRALSALFQLFFHLGTLAADLVDQAALSAGAGRGWRMLQRMHAWLAWLMKGPTALLQLGMLLLAVFAAAALVAPQLQGQLLAAACGLASMALAAAGVLAWLKASTPPGRWMKLLLFAAPALASLGAAAWALGTEVPLPRIYFGASALIALATGAWLVERYARVTQGVRVPGHLVVVGTTFALFAVGRHLLPRVTTLWEWMLTTMLTVLEGLLAAVLVSWGLFVAVQVFALLLGLWLGRRCDASQRATLHTARVALVGSSGAFAVLSLVLWSVLSFVAGRALAQLLYEPALFGYGYRSGEIFLEERMQTLGTFFTPLVLAFGVAAAAAFLVLLPSLREELAPAPNLDAKGVRKGAQDWTLRLGNWLGGGTRALGVAMRALLPAGAIAGSVLYLAFLIHQVAFNIDGLDPVARWLEGWLFVFRGETLVAVGKWLAGGAITLAALGSRFTDTFGRLRVAVDAVLDVDNYFSDPPNRLPPRARIFSRYASLLDYLRQRGYERIVIVAHSQGSVISADLLRYLHAQRRLRTLVGNLPVMLVTVGSPLRDLYAERFPLLYRWMGSNAGGFEAASPSVADIGAVEWVNAVRSGDYVGRFIWTPWTDPQRFRIASVEEGRVAARRSGGRTEFCLGAGGHTHYFSNDAIALAVEIDRLISAPLSSG